MGKLIWGTVGERYYETGVDRGVLYLPNEVGVVWNGLKSVQEDPDGGEPQPYYVDGFKYINVSSSEEFAATIEAYSSPYEFGICDGTVSISNGLFVTQQPRVTFGLSYRTLVGNDLDGLSHAYKLHILYNAMAAPASKSNVSLSDSADPTLLSWDIQSAPPRMTGYKPTSHLVVDSRRTPAALLAEIEGYLYGTDETQPTLPPAQDILDLFTNWSP